MSKKQKKANSQKVVNKVEKKVEMKIVPPAPETKEETKVEEAKVEEVKPAINVINTGQLKENLNPQTSGLSPDKQVDLLAMMDRTFRQDKNAAAHCRMSQEAVNMINEISAIGQVAVLMNEVVNGTSDFAVRMRIGTLDNIKKIAPMVGIEIVENALPAPVDGVVEVQSKALKVSEEAKKALKAEKKAVESKVLDPKDVKTKEELTTALLQFLSKRNNIHENIQQAIAFMREYKNVNATDETREAVKQLTRIELLKEIVATVEEAPIVLSGIGNFLYTTTSTSKSPISAFCHFRNTTLIKETGEPTLDDAEVADYVKILVTWACEIKKRQATAEIKKIEDNLKVLQKDKKNNKVAIAEQEKKIETQKNNIVHFDDVIDYITNASEEFVTRLIPEYEKKEMMFVKTFNVIASSYYSDEEVKQAKLASLKKNVEQRAGIITNLFRSPLSQMINYSESNITELEKVESEPEKNQFRPMSQKRLSVE